MFNFFVLLSILFTTDTDVLILIAIVFFFLFFSLGLPKDPKYSHLTDLHQALKLCTKALLWGTSSNFSMGNALEVILQFLL